MIFYVDVYCSQAADRSIGRDIIRACQFCSPSNYFLSPLCLVNVFKISRLLLQFYKCLTIITQSRVSTPEEVVVVGVALGRDTNYFQTVSSVIQNNYIPV